MRSVGGTESEKKTKHKRKGTENLKHWQSVHTKPISWLKEAETNENWGHAEDTSRKLLFRR